jgi:hypothetical protein
LVGCSSIGSELSQGPAGDGKIFCDVFFRSNPGISFREESVFIFRDEPAQENLEFDIMTFTVNNLVDEFERKSLIIAINDLDYGGENTRQLYQFDQQKVEIQFMGGHGFTGLQHVSHTKSSAESSISAVSIIDNVHQ